MSEIKALATDIGSVLIFHKDPTTTGFLNPRHAKLLAENPDYNFWDHFKIDEALFETYRQVSQAVPVHIFTSKYIQEHPPLAARFDEIMTSVMSAARMGVSKTDAEAYHAVARNLNLNPKEVLFVDDTPANVEAARAAGMEVVHYTSVDQAIAEIKQALSI